LFSCSLFTLRVARSPAGVRFPLEEKARIAFEGKIVGSLRKNGSHVYVATDKGKLYCLDGTDQKVVWEYGSEAGLIFSPVTGTESLFILDQEGRLTRLDKSGKPVWKSGFKNATPASMSLGPGGLYIGTQEGSLLALDAASGEILWQFDTGGAILARTVFWEDRVVCGSLDGEVYVLNRKGHLLGTLSAGSPVQVTPLVDGDRVYLGTEDCYFHCVDLRRMKRKWKILLGGRILAPPRADEKRVFLSASNSVLYCLNKKSGEILWWRPLPSRSPYEIEFSDGGLVVSSFSSTLVGWDRKTGEAIGTYDAGSEVRSNPAWLDSRLLIPLHDPREDMGSLVFLGRMVEVKLSPSLASPQPAGTEIRFTASAVGFERPKFEFMVHRDGEKIVVQKASEKNSWVWFPEKEGDYHVGVKVKDAWQEKEVELAFVIVAGKKQEQDKLK